MKLFTGWLAAGLLLHEGAAGSLRHAGAQPGGTPAPMPWIGKYMLKAVEQHVNVAEMAAQSSKASGEAMLVEQEKLAAETAQEQASDFAASGPSADSIRKALATAESYAEEAQAYAKHANDTLALFEKIPQEVAMNVTQLVEDQVRKDAYAAAESKAAEKKNDEEERKKKAADTVAAAAEPYHLAILKAQKNVQLSLAKSKQAADKVNQLAAESQAIGRKAVRLQEKGETLLAQQLLLEAHQKMQKSMEMKHWVGEFYKDANEWNAEIGTFQSHQQAALANAAGTHAAIFTDEEARKLPPLPTV